MAYYPFNGATATFAGITFNITSFSLEGGDRAEVDVTNSSSTSREVVPGFRNPRRVTLGINYNGELAGLDTALANCATGALAISVGSGCAEPASLLSLNAWVMSYDLSADLDGIVTGSVTFMVDELT